MKNKLLLVVILDKMGERPWYDFLESPNLDWWVQYMFQSLICFYYDYFQSYKSIEEKIL